MDTIVNDGTNPAAGAAPPLRMVDAAAVPGLPRRTLSPGVTYAQLWAQGRSFAGIFWLESHAIIPEHEHRFHCHHIWTLEGQVEILGRTLSPGSYAYVAPGEPHDLVAGPEGATAYYLYLVISAP